MVWAIARYVLIAVAALVVGIALNFPFRNGLHWQNFSNPVFYRFLIEDGAIHGQNFADPFFYALLGLYGAFHAVALLVARILSLIFSVRVRSILYLSVSIVGFLASIYLVNPLKVGVHFFMICWGSLVLVALDYFWRANARHRSETPS